MPVYRQLVDLVSNQTVGGTKTFSSPVKVPDGTAAAPGLTPTTQTDMGIYRASSNNLGLASAGTSAATISAASFNIASSRVLNPVGGLSVSGRYARSTYFPYNFNVTGGDPVIVGDITDTQTSIPIDDSLYFSNTTLPRSMKIDSEWIVVTAIASNTLTCVRGRLGTTAASHTDGTGVFDYENSWDNWVIATNSAPVTNFGSGALSQDITIWLPPRATTGTWSAPAARYEYTLVFLSLDSYTVTIKEGLTGAVIATITGSGGDNRAAITVQYDTGSINFIPLSIYQE